MLSTHSSQVGLLDVSQTFLNWRKNFEKCIFHNWKNVVKNQVVAGWNGLISRTVLVINSIQNEVHSQKGMQ